MDETTERSLADTGEGRRNRLASQEILRHPSDPTPSPVAESDLRAPETNSSASASPASPPFPSLPPTEPSWESWA